MRVESFRDSPGPSSHLFPPDNLGRPTLPRIAGLMTGSTGNSDATYANGITSIVGNVWQQWVSSFPSSEYTQRDPDAVQRIPDGNSSAPNQDRRHEADTGEGQGCTCASTAIRERNHSQRLMNRDTDHGGHCEHTKIAFTIDRCTTDIHHTDKPMTQPDRPLPDRRQKTATKFIANSNMRDGAIPLTVKEKRRRVNDEQLALLRKAYSRNPFPTCRERDLMGRELFMTSWQIQI